MASWWDQAQILKEDACVVKTSGYFIGFTREGDIAVAGGYQSPNQKVNCPQVRLWQEVLKIRKLK